MDLDSADTTKSPLEASIGGCTINKELAIFNHTHQYPESQAPSAGDICGSEQTDPESRKECEARWLKLFQLVEKQCQEQIAGQQDQFNHQLQLIHKEIKRLAQLQEGGSAWNGGTGDAILTQASNAHPPIADTGQRSEDEERGESTSSAFHLLREPDIQSRAFITQEYFQESTSISSGYGTLSASEPNACLSSCSQNTSRRTSLPTKQTLRECRSEFTKHPHLSHTPVDCEKPFMLVPDTKCLTHLEKPSDLTGSHMNYENRTVSPHNQPNKPLTTWAQKLKRTHPKRSVHMEQSPSTRTSPHLERDSDITDGSSNTFFLNNRPESVNSLFSAASGFTYWMLDEKDLFHPLPDSLETGVSKMFHTKELDEPKVPSLTDIYHRNQREYEQPSAWELLPLSEHTHPPEILTLDPTLHKKRIDGISLGNENYTAPLTPDSILESAPYKQYDEESLSADSSLLGDSPNRTPHRYQTNQNVNYQPCQGDTSVDEKMNCTENDANSLTPSSMPESPLPVAEENISHPSGAFSVDHPVMLSNMRRSLREKHARHLADLRDYYESEISNLKQQLEANNNATTTSEDVMKISSLTERCSHMEDALAEASRRIRLLENKNTQLEKQATEWKEQYCSASKTSKDLQEHIEEMRTRSKEKENAISRLQSRLKDVEGSFEKAFKQSDEKDERIKQEHKMLQDLLLEYESLKKEHEIVKDTLSITENKLCDSQSQVKELKRTVSKLETQIKQLEHEHMVKLRHVAQGQSWSFTSNKDWTSVTSATQFTDNKATEISSDQDTTYVPNRYHSPPEKDALHSYMAANPKTEDSTKESPILKALRDFEEEKGLKSWSKESSLHRLSTKPHPVGFSDFCTPHASPNKSRDPQKRLNSPAGPRSSSLPPTSRKTSTVTTPTKRELMLSPLQVKYSPKRSPSENLSPGLSQLLCDEENTMTRFDVAWAESSQFKEPSPRKRLQFMSLENSEESQKSARSPEISSQSQSSLVLPPYETEITYNERMKSMADTERLFDELTEEKKQIEAALSRMPSVGRRMSMQTRAMKENLEDRLEKINRELGSIRMTLKKYHILPTSANI